MRKKAENEEMWKISRRINTVLKNTKLKKKVQIIFAGCMVGYLLMFLGLFFVYYHLEVVRTAQRSDEKLADSMINTLVSEGQNVNNITKLIMTDDTIRSYFNAESGQTEMLIRSTQNSIAHYTYLLDYVSSIYVMRLDADYLSSNIDQVEVQKDRIQEADFREELEQERGGAIYRRNGNGAFLNISGEDTISFMRAVNDIDTQKLVGYLSVNMSTAFFENACKDLLEVEGMGIQIWDDEGILAELGRGFASENDSLYDTENSQIVHKAGTTYHILWKEIEDWGVFLRLEHPIMISDSQRNGLLLFGGILFVFSLLCLWGVRWVVVNQITNPIAKLVASMGKVKDGWLYRVSMETGNDEIGILKDSYNQMLVDMNRLIETSVNQEKEKQRLEMEILQEQIKPHFLYNILYTIESQALEQQDHQVADSLQTLGDFYRKFLSKGDRAVPVKVELELVSDYLKLQALRYGDAFEAVVKAEENVKDYLIPKLTLQPLVENSIYHGVRLKGEGCRIVLRAYLKEERLWIHVYDDGVGMPLEKLEEVLKTDSGKSFGLKSTIQRLKHFYGEEEIFEIHSEEGEYTEVILKLPVKER